MENQALCCIFSIPMCPSCRLLRHLSCNSGGMHSHEPFKRHPQLNYSSSWAPQNCLVMQGTVWYLAGHPLRVGQLMALWMGSFSMDLHIMFRWLLYIVDM